MSVMAVMSLLSPLSAASNHVSDPAQAASKREVR